MTPQNQQLLIIELRRDEGVRYVVYLDSVGVPTIGVGHNLKVSPLPLSWTPPLNDQQVNQLLIEDLQKMYAGLNQNLPWWSSLDDVRQRVLCNMAFNIGVNGLLGFHMMLNAVQDGNYETAALDMENSRWFGQVGDRAVRLRDAMSTGVMPVVGGIA